MEACTVDDNGNSWWGENGATRHVTHSLAIFSTFKEFERKCFFKAARKEALVALGSGDIHIATHDSQELVLRDVWYVPNISKNLFSVLASQDINPNSVFTSTDTECVLVVNGKEVVHGIREMGGTLFKAQIRSVIPANLTVNAMVEDDSTLQLYQERWGHQDKNHIKNLLKKELDVDVRVNKNTVCESCIYGKAHRQPFGTRDKAEKPGELMQADLCGPFKPSFQKKLYLSLIHI